MPVPNPVTAPLLGGVLPVVDPVVRLKPAIVGLGLGGLLAAPPPEKSREEAKSKKEGAKGRA